VTWTPFLLLALAALLDVGANVLLKRSSGLKHRLPALGAITLILLAFSLLGVALKSVPLGVAYAVWGGLGIVLTALLSLNIDGARLTTRGWAGLTLIVGSVLLMHLGEPVASRCELVHRERSTTAITVRIGVAAALGAQARARSPALRARPSQRRGRIPNRRALVSTLFEFVSNLAQERRWQQRLAI